MPPSLPSVPSRLRIIRGEPPPGLLNEHSYQKALPYLLRDSENRCAYSTLHKDDVAPGEMHVEHFDPRKVGGVKNHSYDNLLPAFGACNRAKGEKWPSQELERLGARFLDPSREHDYGVHLFEDPVSHKIVAETATGKFHLRYTALNCDYLVKKRGNRAKAEGPRQVPTELMDMDLIPGRSRDDLESLIRNAEMAILPIPYWKGTTTHSDP